MIQRLLIRRNIGVLFHHVTGLRLLRKKFDQAPEI